MPCSSKKQESIQQSDFSRFSRVTSETEVLKDLFCRQFVEKIPVPEV